MQKSIGKSKIRPPVKSLKIRFQFQTWHTWLRRGHYPSCNFWIESVQWGLPQSRGNITQTVTRDPNSIRSLLNCYMQDLTLKISHLLPLPKYSKSSIPYHPSPHGWITFQRRSSSLVALYLLTRHLVYLSHRVASLLNSNLLLLNLSSKNGVGCQLSLKLQANIKP